MTDNSCSTGWRSYLGPGENGFPSDYDENWNGKTKGKNGVPTQVRP